MRAGKAKLVLIIKAGHLVLHRVDQSSSGRDKISIESSRANILLQIVALFALCRCGQKRDKNQTSEALCEQNVSSLPVQQPLGK